MEESPESQQNVLKLVEGFTPEEIRRHLYVSGPWNDPELDVARPELLSFMAPEFAVALSQLEDARARGSWTPADVMFANGSGKGSMVQTDRSKKHRLGSEQTELSENHPLWRNRLGELVMSSTDVSPGGVLLLNTQSLVEEGSELTVLQRSALYIDGLTEDNLPNYARIIAEVFYGSEEATAFLRQWLADEDLHKLGFDLYMHLTQAVNPYLLENERTELIRSGRMPTNDSPFSMISYVVMQEPATKIAHRNTPKTEDGLLGPMLGLIAGHENEHGEAYLHIATKLVEQYPSQMILAFKEAVYNFEMPGSDIKGFSEFKKILAWGGVFDPVDFYNIAVETSTKMGLFDQDNDALHPEAQEALQAIHKRFKQLHKVSNRFEKSRQAVRDDVRDNGPEKLKKFRDPFSVGLSREVVVWPYKRAKNLTALPDELVR